MKAIPLNPVPSQTLSIVLNDQLVDLAVYQRRYGVFMDVSVDGALVIGGVICQNLNRVVREKYRGFSGDFVWQDTHGSDDPDYTGFGDRWQLYYLTPDELATVSSETVWMGT